ncbi:hypothetical protein ANCCEY_03333 [Ancylostoma ceylanicum]|uniref:Secreted protein n=1 Tax=Ancylostoma ceylanicum TaxID=53326 RepID=A0A0D6LZW2_9BILA|nr:hypothetical protein ANCCEY_03333 [Ancylostoma ceylanicum]
MNGFLVYLATLHAAVYVAYSQSDLNSQVPPARTKRLEIASKSRGARCRCIEDTCRMFVFASGVYLPCEEF